LDLSLLIPYIGPPQESAKGFRLVKDVKAAMVLAAAQGILCGGDSSAGASMGCLPQFPWGLFLTSCTPLRTKPLILESVMLWMSMESAYNFVGFM
jgi:hypothetical protein